MISYVLLALSFDHLPLAHVLDCPLPAGPPMVPAKLLLTCWHCPYTPSSTASMWIHIFHSLSFSLLSIFLASYIFPHFIHVSWIRKYIDIAMNESRFLHFIAMGGI